MKRPATAVTISRCVRSSLRAIHIASSAVDTPAVFGVWRPTVLLPLDLVRSMPLEALRPILAHELIHVRRGDLVAAMDVQVVRLVTRLDTAGNGDLNRSLGVAPR